MELVLITLAGAGLIGCFGATLRGDLSGRRNPGARRLSRPRSSTVARELA
jgi:hypothetical protein